MPELERKFDTVQIVSQLGGEQGRRRSGKGPKLRSSVGSQRAEPSREKAPGTFREKLTDILASYFRVKGHRVPIVPLAVFGMTLGVQTANNLFDRAQSNTLVQNHLANDSTLHPPDIFADKARQPYEAEGYKIVGQEEAEEGLKIEQRMVLDLALVGTRRVAENVADQLRANGQQVTQQEFDSHVARRIGKNEPFLSNGFNDPEFYSAIRVAPNPYVSTVISEAESRPFDDFNRSDQNITVGETIFSINEDGNFVLVSAPVDYNDKTDCFRLKERLCKPGKVRSNSCFEVLPQTECGMKGNLGEIMNSIKNIRYLCGAYILNNFDNDYIVARAKEEEGATKTWNIKGPLLNVDDYDCKNGEIILEVVEFTQDPITALLKIHGGELGDVLNGERDPIGSTLALNAATFTSQKIAVNAVAPEPMKALNPEEALLILNGNIENNEYLSSLKTELDALNDEKNKLSTNADGQQRRLDGLRRENERTNKLIQEQQGLFSAEYEKLATELRANKIVLDSEQSNAFANRDIQSLGGEEFTELKNLAQLISNLETSFNSKNEEIKRENKGVNKMKGEVAEIEAQINLLQEKFDFVFRNFQLLALDSLITEIQRVNAERDKGILREKFATDEVVRNLIIEFYPDLLNRQKTGLKL